MTGLIILAAGASNRLGEPKQNLFYKGQTLLQHAVTASLEAECQPILVVLGAHAEQVVPLAGTRTLYNQHWQEGMASSIWLAIQEINNSADTHQVIIMVCDQPYVQADLLNALITQQTQTGKSLIASAYQDTIGVPALFDRNLFPDLLALTGNEGAKVLIQRHSGQVATVSFEPGAIDIDTLADYQRLVSGSL